MAEWNYLRSYCRLLEDTEVPPRFAIWCGIGSLLASLERRIWIPQGLFTIYPNFYMILIAASGQKKSTAVNLASKLLRRLDPAPNVVSQKITPEALIGAIQGVKIEIKNQIVRPAGGIVLADELATFLDRNSLERGLGPILTALYDCTPFEYTTKMRGTETVEDGYLSILGATTIELLRNSLPKDAIGGGFTSRTMFVYEDKIAPPVPWIDHDQALVDLEVKLVDYLGLLMKLHGAVTITPEAKEWFKADYKDRYYRGNFRTDPMLKQYENRRSNHLFKVAMALMVCEQPSLRLELSHLTGAKFILEEAEEYLPRVMELVVASESGAQSSAVYAYIVTKKEVLRADIVRHFSHVLNAQEMSNHLDTLRQAGKITYDTTNGKLVYKAVKVGVRI